MLVRTKFNPSQVVEASPAEIEDYRNWGVLLTDNAYLYVTWFMYPGGPVVSVTEQTITITKSGQGSPLVGPTPIGITVTGTGAYRYGWSEGDRDGAGDYLIEWEAVDQGGEAVTASETITLT